MKKVLVTGVNGFVGHHLAKELTEHGVEVIGIGGHVGGSKPTHVSSYHTLDLLDHAAVDAIKLHQVEGVIHLAGLAAVGPSFNKPAEYINTNVGLEINLFESALSQGVTPRFVIVSSGALYGAKNKLPITETSRVAPNSPYAVSKLCQEQMALYYQTRGFDVMIARPFNHIGPGQNTGFILPDLVSQVIAFEHGKTSTITVGNLDAKRDYTDVRDIVRAYRLLLEYGKSGEIYNICNGNSYSGHEMVEIILKNTSTHPSVTPDVTRMRPSDTPNIYGSHKKLTSTTGWKPEITINETIKDVVSDWRTR